MSQTFSCSDFSLMMSLVWTIILTDTEMRARDKAKVRQGRTAEDITCLERVRVGRQMQAKRQSGTQENRIKARE